MNTADFSVLSDELIVSLNPLRRGAYRARAACVKLAGLAMPWNTASAGDEPRQRSRSGTSPARWPFPPTPAQEGGLAEQAVTRRVAPAVATVLAPAVNPAMAPAMSPAMAPAMPAAAARERSLGNATVEPVTSQVTMKAMVLDVVMVLAWGAIIPGLMWLGAAAGF